MTVLGMVTLPICKKKKLNSYVLTFNQYIILHKLKQNMKLSNIILLITMIINYHDSFPLQPSLILPGAYFRNRLIPSKMLLVL